MKVGVFTALLSQLPLDEVLKKLKAFQIDTVELGTGNYPGDAHCKLSMLENSSALDEFKSRLADHGASISALSCHGNALHPDADRARQAREISRKTILLAERVKIAVEMHPGFVVYSPETMLRLRSLTGPAVGCNYDPSHMFWQGIDPIAAIRILGDAIFHVHAKDTQLYTANLPLTGVLDTNPYTDERNRGWIFRTCGYGHGAEWWKEFASTLRMFGYDNVLSIEHEDSLLSPEEGLRKAAQLLNEIVIREQPTAAWWV